MAIHVHAAVFTYTICHCYMCSHTCHCYMCSHTCHCYVVFTYMPLLCCVHIHAIAMLYSHTCHCYMCSHTCHCNMCSHTCHCYVVFTYIMPRIVVCLYFAAIQTTVLSRAPAEHSEGEGEHHFLQHSGR